jgi:hypothetical protein
MRYLARNRSLGTEAASEAETVISSLRKIRQDDNVWQELYQDIAKLAEKQNVLPSKPRTAGRQQNSNNKSNHEAEILKGKFQLHSISITTSP